METQLLKLFQNITPTLSTWVVFAFVFHFFRSLYPRRFKHIFPIICGYVLLSLSDMAVNLLHSPFVNAAFVFIAVNIVSMILFKINLSTAILYNQLYISALSFCEVLAMAVVSINSDTNVIELIHTKEGLAVVSVVFICFTFICTRIFIVLVSHNKRVNIRLTEIGILILFSAFELFVINYMVIRSFNLSDVNHIFITSVGFLVFNVFVAVEISKVSELINVKHDADIMKKQNAIQLEHYEKMMSNYNDYRRLVHDMRKHLNILDEIALEGSDKYRQYSGKVYNKLESIFDEFECGNQILSIVMTQKIREAKENNIRTDFQVEDIDLDFIDDVDITAIFSNLWDNAIEACLEVPVKDRYIRVSMVKKQDLILIEFENSCRSLPKMREGQILSTKAGHHFGIGLQIVRSSVEKYRGKCLFNAKPHIFTTTLILDVSKFTESQQNLVADVDN